MPATLNSVTKIDTSNAQQMQEAHALFSHNMGAIDFWLRYCVFPLEMQQFPKRLLSSAWHLADNDSKPGGVVGFSGTNDNHRLLPLQARQQAVDGGEQPGGHQGQDAGCRLTNATV